MARSAPKEVADAFPWILGQIDEHGKSLTSAKIVETLTAYGNGGPSTPAGVAARLAVECGAFGYDDFAKARDAFRKLAASRG